MSVMRIDADVDAITTVEIVYGGKTYSFDASVLGRAVADLLQATITMEQLQVLLNIPQLSKFASEYVVASLIEQIPRIEERAKKVHSAGETISRALSRLQGSPPTPPPESVPRYETRLSARLREVEQNKHLIPPNLPPGPSEDESKPCETSS